jgi:hypothetical protein
VAFARAARKFPWCPTFPALSSEAEPGRYLKRWSRRLTAESFSREDALILSYASFGYDEIEETFGVEMMLTNDLRMQARYERGSLALRHGSQG